MEGEKERAAVALALLAPTVPPRASQCHMPVALLGARRAVGLEDPTPRRLPHCRQLSALPAQWTERTPTQPRRERASPEGVIQRLRDE